MLISDGCKSLIFVTYKVKIIKLNQFIRVMLSECEIDYKKKHRKILVVSPALIQLRKGFLRSKQKLF